MSQSTPYIGGLTPPAIGIATLPLYGNKQNLKQNLQL
ncbi:hypothetical protein ABIE26_000067 [Pedobacter africanus]|uniref:Uncharacterized protein n=1 Tax=Pedobacter africanus TaxID=151894 RepID=A0ACC6KVP6_9SPHI|nr:hypothetical protein [Pedobacter africanus]